MEVGLIWHSLTCSDLILLSERFYDSVTLADKPTNPVSEKAYSTTKGVCITYIGYFNPYYKRQGF